METLAERVAWILDNLKRPDGSKWTARALSEEAGLASPAHVGMIKRGEAKNVRADTVAALARATGVSERWLLTGQGAHDDSSPAPSPRDDDMMSFASLPDHRALLARARELEPDLPAWVWEKLVTMHYELEAEPTAVMVAEWAKWIHRHERALKPRGTPAQTGGHQAVSPKRKSG